MIYLSGGIGIAVDLYQNLGINDLIKDLINKGKKVEGILCVISIADVPKPLINAQVKFSELPLPGLWTIKKVYDKTPGFLKGKTQLWEMEVYQAVGPLPLSSSPSKLPSLSIVSPSISKVSLTPALPIPKPKSRLSFNPDTISYGEEEIAAQKTAAAQISALIGAPIYEEDEGQKYQDQDDEKYLDPTVGLEQQRIQREITRLADEKDAQDLIQRMTDAQDIESMKGKDEVVEERAPSAVSKLVGRLRDISSTPSTVPVRLMGAQDGIAAKISLCTGIQE